MSLCAPCTEIKSIPKCLTTLQIGKVAAFVTAYYLFIRNVATGHVTRISFTSGAAGEINIDFSATDFKFSDELEYEIWVSLVSSNNPEVRATITLLDAVTTGTCLSVTPRSYKDDDGAELVFTTVTVYAA